MKHSIAILSAIGALACTNVAVAQHGHGHHHHHHGAIHDHGHDRMKIAVFGDWPYSTVLLSEAPLLIDSINSDCQVRRVLFLGDIHSGSMPCTGVGLTVPPPVYDPTWNLGIYQLFNQFQDPFIYTPGDNEWCDCHKKKEGDNVVGSGAPLNELAAVRELFFSEPGRTLGQHPMHVLSQAEEFDAAFPTDANYVENFLWMESDVVFVTLNMPGSNNDGRPWTGPYADEAARLQEVAERNGANSRWLDAAFDLAEDEHAAGVLIGIQADMWDPEAAAPDGDGLDGYTAFVNQLAMRSIQFGRPVLLMNGDSHAFEVDQPLADPYSAQGMIHGAPAVPNLTRITVEGSTLADEWVRLSIDPQAPGVFTWERVQYLP